MPNILVVGGAGYIGSHTCLSLLEKNYSVTVFDNLCRGNKWWNEEVLFIDGDIRSTSDVSKLFSSNKYDLVMHFAALAYVGESMLEPNLYYDTNVAGTINLLSSMLKNKANKLVFSSSCAVYGSPNTLSIDESLPLNPINPYGETKKIIENMLKDYNKAYDFNSISLRYFNAAGCDPLGRAHENHVPETHLIPLVLEEALRVKNGGDPKESCLKINASSTRTPDGTCIRDFIHVTDIANAHILAAEALLKKESRGAMFYNLANGSGYSSLQIIEACKKITSQEIQFKLVEPRIGDPAILIGNSQLIHNNLGWECQISKIEDIISSAWISMNNKEFGN